MDEGTNILTVRGDLAAAMVDLPADLPVSFDIEQVTDQPESVAEPAGEFTRTFAEVLMIVLAVSFLSVG